MQHLIDTELKAKERWNGKKWKEKRTFEHERKVSPSSYAKHQIFAEN